ncbi:MAG TPA: hypothetical protein P5531_11180 [Bacteroidales bacterium]|nr:hypothetical protein [Bacteroidales bacterium]HSA44167.1 hypothetical protein [Bacteroidales bacterium]
MKTYSITIPDNKENLFIEWMKSVSFVKKIEDVSDIDIPEEHKQLVRQRMKQLEENPKSMLNWEDIESKIKL